MSAWAGLTSALVSVSAGTSTLVCTALEAAVSDVPDHTYVAELRLVTVRAGPESTLAWNVTAPPVPPATDPRANVTVPFAPATKAPASSPVASVRGVPFQRRDPAT